MFRFLVSRRFWADTWPMMVSSIFTGMFNEIIIIRMTVGQSVRARLIALVINFFTARPYGMYRDWIFEKLKAHHQGRICKSFADTIAYLSFQLPLYALVLLLSGASFVQIVSACATSSIMLAIVARPYGIFLVWSRKCLGLHKEKLQS